LNAARFGLILGDFPTLKSNDVSSRNISVMHHIHAMLAYSVFIQVELRYC